MTDTYDLDNPEHCAKIMERYLKMSEDEFEALQNTVEATLFMLETAREMREDRCEKGGH